MREPRGKLRSFGSRLWTITCFFSTVASSVFLARAVAAGDDSPALKPDTFLSRYCLGCHDSDTRKGDRRLDDLPLVIG